MRGNLVPIELDLFSGAAPAANPILLARRAGIANLYNADYSLRMRTLSKRNGNTQLSPSLGASVSAVVPFTYTELSGVVTRKLVALAGTTLYEIVSPSSAPAITTHEPVLRAEPLSSLVMANRLHMASQGNTPIKYDGASVTRWGLSAPGETPTERVAFDSTSGWTTNVNCSVAADTAIRVRGAASMRLTKGSASDTATSANVSLSMDLSGGSGNAYLWLFLPMASYDMLRDSTTVPLAIHVTLGDAALVNAGTWVFAKADLYPGWNLLAMDLGAPDISTGTGPPLASITTMQMLVRTVAAGDLAVVYFDFFHTTNPDSCTAAIGGAVGSVEAGTFEYYVTFVSKYGIESNAGPASNSVTLAIAWTVALSAIPVSPDPQCVARRLYRSDDAGGTKQLLTQIDDNTTTTYTDTTATSTLSSTGPPLPASATNDASAPPFFSFVAAYRAFAVGVEALRPTTLRISNSTLAYPGGHETFPLLSEVVVPAAATALGVHPTEGLLVFTLDAIYQLVGEGTDASPFDLVLRNDHIGCNDWRQITRVAESLVVCHESSVYELADLSQPWLLSQPMRIGATSRLGLLVDDRARGRLVVGRTSSYGGSMTTTESLFYRSGIAGVVAGAESVTPTDLRRGIWTKETYFAASTDMAALDDASGMPRLLAGDSSGFVSQLSAVDHLSLDYTDRSGASTQPVDLLLYAWIPLHSLPGGRGEVRYVEIDGAASSGSWQVAIEYYEAPSDLVPLGAVSVTGINATKATVTAIPRGVRGAFAQIYLAHSTAALAILDRVVVYVAPRYAPRGARA